MKNRGVTLFIAIVVMSVLLFVSFAVVNIAIKGTLLASSSRDSQYAFYAADAGLECVFYWDSKFDSFSTSTPGTISCVPGEIISTNSQSEGTGNPVPTNPIKSSLIGGGGDGSINIFYFDMNQAPNPVPYCAIVIVTKSYEDRNPVDGYKETLETRIESRGYNTCDISSKSRVERGIEVIY